MQRLFDVLESIVFHPTVVVLLSPGQDIDHWAGRGAQGKLAFSAGLARTAWLHSRILASIVLVLVFAVPKHASSAKSYFAVPITPGVPCQI